MNKLPLSNFYMVHMTNYLFSFVSTVYNSIFPFFLGIIIIVEAYLFSAKFSTTPHHHHHCGSRVLSIWVSVILSILALTYPNPYTHVAFFWSLYCVQHLVPHNKWQMLSVLYK